MPITSFSFNLLCFMSIYRYWKDERDRFQGCQEEAEQVKKKLEKFTLMEQVWNISPPKN